MRGKVEACEYTTSDVCQCNRTIDVNFTYHIMRDVLLGEIYNADIRREMHGIDRILQQPANDVIAIHGALITSILLSWHIYDFLGIYINFLAYT